MTTRAAKSAAAEEIAAIEELVNDLEKRLRRLSSTARSEASGASGDVRDFVSEALERITSRVRESAPEVTRSVADKTSQLGSDAFKRVTNEVEARPFLTLAIAAGVGFLCGLASRRQSPT